MSEEKLNLREETVDKVAIGQRVKEVRITLGLNQADMADIVGMHRAGYSPTEKGKKYTFTLTQLLLIKRYAASNGLLVSLDYLVDGAKESGITKEALVKEDQSVVGFLRKTVDILKEDKERLERDIEYHKEQSTKCSELNSKLIVKLLETTVS